MTGSRWIWSGIAAVIAVATAVAVGIRCMPEPILPLKQNTEISADEPMHVQAAESPDDLLSAAEALPENGYLLKLDGDILQVYAEGSRTPAAEYELPAGWLPDYDRILLEYGMRVGSEDELRRLIEDYLS